MATSGVPIQPKDTRGYFMLPQALEDSGYYVYGNKGGVPGTGHLAQYAHADMLSMIFHIEREWQAMSSRKFGIGNIREALIYSGGWNRSRKKCPARRNTGAIPGYGEDLQRRWAFFACTESAIMNKSVLP